MSKKLLAVCAAALFAVSSVAYAQQTVPISQLPSATQPLAGSEIIPCVQGGVTKGCLASSVAGQSSGISSGLVNGVTNAGNANAGVIGEYVSSSFSAVSLTNAMTSNLTSITLTAGDWDVTGSVSYTAGSSSTILAYNCGISTTSSTPPTGFGQAFGASGLNIVSNQSSSCLSPRSRINVAATTIVYFVGTPFFSGTATASGFVQARRVR